jgi:hypothetical protein
MKPVGWWNKERRIHWLDAVLETKEDGWDTPLYTAPRELSDEEILDMSDDYVANQFDLEFDGNRLVAYVRAVIKKASEG